MDKGRDFFDFLQYVAKDDRDRREYGKKVLSILKNPKASPKELFDVFNSQGFTVSREHCEKLKGIDPKLIPDIDDIAYGY